MPNFRVFACTWNIATLDPPQDEKIVKELLQSQQKEVPDIYTIGLQEVSSKPHHYLRDTILDDPWTDWICRELAPQGYIKVKDIRLQGLVLLLLVKLEHVPFVRNIHTNYTRTGLGGLWGNKGGVSIRFGLYGASVCIVNCHLEAHLEGWAQRNKDYVNIINDQYFEACSTKGILDHDYVIWLGDLNYRIADLKTEDVKEVIARNELHILKYKDQLCLSKDAGDVFKDFSEGDLTFPPTYKLDFGTMTYDSSAKQRKPGWCDRILWKVNKGRESRRHLHMELDRYDSHRTVLWSDHLPVSADLRLKVEKTDVKPPVNFRHMEPWKIGQDSQCIYFVHIDTQTSSWDWIALYKIGFRNPNNYETYVWAVKDGENMQHGCRVVFESFYLPKDTSCQYVLGYYSSLMESLLGVSEPFQILNQE
ncbi:phosphatidylinositol 4,5-bisphosphate 5-phosphatase A-like isoform X2 [Ptychodera flava]|uniref:phosphatidylinositol 4,5-bisphosphate 5-phosphatase A-like isoform X2 n=1 Tax=Ptychodera flava TaxID=63121 RepID=UPI00396AA2D2